METVKAHFYSPDEEDCLLFRYEFTGLVRKENIVQEVAITSDMWSYLDDDFHVEITEELYHYCLARVCDKSNADNEKIVSLATWKTDTGRTLRLPHRFRE